MGELLDRWIQIADYLKVSEKTALRYKDRGMPLTYDPAGHPITTKSALDEWRYGKLKNINQPSAQQ